MGSMEHDIQGRYILWVRGLLTVGSRDVESRDVGSRGMGLKATTMGYCGHTFN